jgi:lysophospholipase L1-like esterase
VGVNSWRRPSLGLVRRSLFVLVLALAAVVLALVVTPTASVSVFGQTVRVGAVAPGPHLGLSGPGEADLFGEGTVDTVQTFRGPIRPKIVWQRFNRNDEAAAFIQSGPGAGTARVGDALTSGWTRYFVRLTIVAAAIGGALYLLTVGLAALAGRDHASRARHLRLLGASVATALVATLGFTALTVRTAVRELGSVSSLSDLVGTATVAQVPDPVGPPRKDVDVVVLGDSTAAGIGNTPLADPSEQDTACQRSADTYAAALQTVSGLRVLNLACSSATVQAGLLGPQYAGRLKVPPQVGALRSVTSAKLVVVSIGANDVGWSDFLTLCYGLPRCDDEASDKLFQSRLDRFKVPYAQLLQTLSDLPGRPEVVVTEYYDPFGSTFDCPALRGPAGGGFDEDKVGLLRADLDRINGVLRQGAEAFGFSVARPRFAGHELCTDQPYVQGLADPAPFHPRAAGELAIAAAVLPRLPT